ncbi:hypothetical protein C0995_015940, partial [Termitomyces sp. Mi166
MQWLTESMVSKLPVRLRTEDTGEAHLCVLRERFKPVVQLHQKCMDKGKVRTQGLSDDDILQLRQAWQQEFADIVNGTKEELPPWREKDGMLWTVLDAPQHNDNTIKDVTPLLDQEVIRKDVVKARYRSKIDLTNAYEQVRIHVKDIPKTVFTSLMGTFMSNIM